MKCAEIMSSNPVCCTDNEPALRAAELMRSENIGSVPVVSGPERRLTGIVTDRDLTIRLIAAGRAPEATTVSDVMSTNPVSCRPEDDVHEAMNAMSRNQVRRIPVVDGAGRLCGMIAQADVARHLDEREAGEVVEDISQPGHNAVGRAFSRARSAMQPAFGQGSNWLVALGIGAALGAGIMAAVDQRRTRTYTSD